MTLERVSNFDMPKRMTKPELEWWILFGIAVAGKSAKQTEKKLHNLMMYPYNHLGCNHPMSPFQRIKFLIQQDKLMAALKYNRMGKYKLLDKAYRAAVNIDLDAISVESLEKIPGIGPKTARMTILYYEPDASVVPLDTHVLKWLRAQGYDAPKATPTGRRYLELEKAFIEEAKKRGMSVRDLDTEVWKKYAIT